VSNSDVAAAQEYHEATKHSLASVRSDRHALDWTNQPRPYKLYVDLDIVPLTTDYPASTAPALSAIAAAEAQRGDPRILDLATLAAVLHYAAGITKQLRHPGGVMDFRAAACTGALYHIELYIVCGDLPDLKAGVYHFGVHDNALRRLRDGDFRSTLIEATADEPGVAAAPVTIVCTSTYWRNAWKYQARAYRHCFWDDGTILANLLAMAAAHDLPAHVVAGFVDADVNRLIGVDGEREAALTLVPLGHAPGNRRSPTPIPPIHPEIVPVSRTELDYAAIRAMHAASSLESPAEVARWRDAAQRATQAVAGQPDLARDVNSLQEPLAETLPAESAERVIQRRGSSRRFERAPISFEALSTMLSHAIGSTPADFAASGGARPTDAYLIVNAVEGLEPGGYVYLRDRQALQRLQAGDFREVASYLALTQSLAGDAAVNVYFLADLQPILDRLGNRGYRAAQLDASIAAGRLYLAAYALGLGATGLTFFDDDVTRFFSPHAEGKSVMFLIALGHRARRQ